MTKKLNKTIAKYIIETASSHKEKALFDVKFKYQAEECKS